MIFILNIRRLPFRKHTRSCGIIAELKLGDIEREILGADFVETANHATLEDAPEAFNRIGVNRTDDVLAGAVPHRLVRVFGQAEIATVYVGRQQIDLVRDGFSTIVNPLL
jgi:hypothetical protein